VGIEELIGPLAVTGATVSTFQSRIEIWQRGIYMIQDFPYTGISMNTFNSIVHVLYPFFLIGPDSVMPHAHNIFLAIGDEFGIPGLVAYVGLLSAFGSTAWAVLRSRTAEWDFRVVTIGLVCGVIAHLIYGLTDAITLANKTGTFIWAAFGLVVAIHQIISEYPVADPTPNS
jgi:O-antigen ligase